MRFRSRGLLVGGIDSDLYVPRPAVETALLRPVEAGGNVLMIGPPGSGKTTALHKLEADLASSVATCFINAMLAESTIELLKLVADNMGVVSGPPPTGVLAAVRRLSGVPARCILLDGPLPASIGRELFGRFRDEVWALEHQWVLTSTPRAATAVRIPPADAFWDRVVSLPQFTDEEVDELLSRGLEGEEVKGLADAQWIPAETWPRDLVRNARAFIEPSTLTAPDVLQELREKQAQLERTPAMVLTELQSMRRPTAAGDPEFLQRLGYSRPYVARALVELEKLGLVQSVTESTDNKSGRPQKLYEPTIDEFA